MTSFVDLDTGRPGWLVGLTPGRSGAAVTAWLSTQDQAWRDGIEVVALDPSAPFAAAIRRALPQATLVVDHFHLVRLANQVLTRSGCGSPVSSTGGVAGKLIRRGRIAGCSWPPGIGCPTAV